MSMKKKFLCPHCGGLLSDQNGVHLNVVNGRIDQKGKIILSKELGNYEVKKSPLLGWQNGDQLTVSCIHKKCVLNLVNDSKKAAVVLQEDGKTSRIVFSTVIGDHLTYKIEKDAHVTHYGKANPNEGKDLWSQFTW